MNKNLLYKRLFNVLVGEEFEISQLNKYLSKYKYYSLISDTYIEGSKNDNKILYTSSVRNRPLLMIEYIVTSSNDLSLNLIVTSIKEYKPSPSY